MRVSAAGATKVQHHQQPAPSVRHRSSRMTRSGARERVSTGTEKAMAARISGSTRSAKITCASATAPA